MTSRRDFLKATGAAGAGLALGLRLEAKPRPGETAKAATAVLGAGTTEMWLGSQSPKRAQERAAAALGLKPDQLKVNVALIGGGFGRRLGRDFSTEAAQVAKAAGGGPIQVVWDREDDLRHDLHHPAALHRLRAGLGASGALTAWAHRIAGPAVLRSWTGGQKAPSQATTEANGAYDIPYAIPAIAVDFAEVEAPTPLGWWRGIQIVPNVFARECFLDEVAHSLGKDPLQFRLDLLGNRGIVKVGHDEADMPLIETHVIPSAEAPAGMGGPPVPVAIPAAMNAVFAATGKRIRKVPIEDDLI